MIHADDIFKKIGAILNDLQDQQEYLAHHPEKINIPEMELFMANADFLTDHIRVFLKMKTKEISEQVQLPTEHYSRETPVADGLRNSDFPIEPVLEKIVEEAEQNDRVDLQPAEEIYFDVPSAKEEQQSAPFEFIIGKDAVVDQFDFENKPAEQLFNRELTDAEIAVIEAKKASLNAGEHANAAVEEEVGPEPFLIGDASEVTPEIAETQLSHTPVMNEENTNDYKQKPTINELLAEKRAAVTNNYAPKSAVIDLKQVINLNDKLLFIKDLFNGYNLAYSEAIDIINKFSDYESADAFLQKNYAEKNNWAVKTQASGRFYELLKLRFPI